MLYPHHKEKALNGSEHHLGWQLGLDIFYLSPEHERLKNLMESVNHYNSLLSFQPFILCLRICCLTQTLPKPLCESALVIKNLFAKSPLSDTCGIHDTAYMILFPFLDLTRRPLSSCDYRSLIHRQGCRRLWISQFEFESFISAL